MSKTTTTKGHAMSTTTDRRAEQMERLEEATRALMSTDGFRRYVTTRKAFHNYSVNNQMLVACQRPTVNGEPTAEYATRVAGFQTWKKLNRSVVKGATGLRIFAPMTVKPKAEELEADPKAKPRVFFKVVSVFDISQTEGEDIAEVPSESIAGSDHGEMLEALEVLAGELGYSVEFRDLSDQAAGGWCDAGLKSIVVGADVSVDEQVRTLAHELCHAQGVGYAEFGRARAELIVEAAAHVALDSMGFDTSGETLAYLAGWGERDDLATLREDLTIIDKIASRVEDALAAKTTTEAVAA